MKYAITVRRKVTTQYVVYVDAKTQDDAQDAAQSFVTQKGASLGGVKCGVEVECYAKDVLAIHDDLQQVDIAA